LTGVAEPSAARRGAGRRAAALVALVALVAVLVVAGPAATAGLVRAVGVPDVMTPYSSLSFVNPFSAAAGLPAGQPVPVVIENETGIPAKYLVRATLGAWSTTIPLELGSGDSREAVFPLPPGVTGRLVVELAGRGLSLAADVR
jgi:hypothetical protein